MRADKIQPPWTFGDPRVIRRGCPACGSTKVARVMMGMPGFTEDLEREFNEGRVQFGGCVITYDIDNGGHSSDPERVCNSCGTEWGRWVAPQSPWPR